MKKIGILLESTICSRYLYETVRELSESRQVKLFFLINGNKRQKGGSLEALRGIRRSKRLVYLMELIFFHFIVKTEHIFLSFFSLKNKDHYKTFNIAQFNINKTTFLTPDISLSGQIMRYPEEELDKIRALDLDLIIRGNTSRILQGGILNSSREGIISIHYADNRWNRGRPHGFWEVFMKKPVTGFVIQILTEEPGGGPVLFRGAMPTRRSYTENAVYLYNESNPYLAKIILQFVDSSQLPVTEENLPFSGKLLNTPSLTQSSRYMLQTGFLYSTIIFKMLILRQQERWGIAFVCRPWRNAVLCKGIRIKNPPGRFFADPFVVTREKRTICFAEDYAYEKKMGRITAIEIIDNNRYEILGPVIEEPFHMSFPYLFEYHNELYMAPESIDIKSIRLYKCIEFPLRWAYCKDILSDVSAADSMVFENRGRWWLLTNMTTKGNRDTCSQLMAFYSDNPLSDDWTAHRQNPIVYDSTIGRNGGILDVDSKFPVRVRQRQAINRYGAGLTLAEITELTPSAFSEEKIAEINPAFFEDIKGCHHFHSNGNVTVYDFLCFMPRRL